MPSVTDELTKLDTDSIASAIKDVMGQPAFGFSEPERKYIETRSYFGDALSAPQTVIIERDGCTVSVFNACLAYATLMTFNEGTLTPANAQFDDALFGDALPRCYLSWLGATGGSGQFNYLSDLRVHPDFQNRGIGSWMLKCVLARVAGRRLYLAANARSSGSERLMEFYERHGFCRIEDTRLMWRAGA